MTTEMPANSSTVYNGSEEMELARKLHWISSSVLGIIFVVLGIFGNILSIIVWSRKNMTSSTGTYLIIQAVIDIFVLVFFVLTDSLTVLFPHIAVSTSYGKFYAWIGFPFFYFAVVLSIWMMVAVTVDRYIQVSHPSRVKVNFTISSLDLFLTICLFQPFFFFTTFSRKRIKSLSMI
jgi:hypothetical protein